VRDAHDRWVGGQGAQALSDGEAEGEGVVGREVREDEGVLELGYGGELDVSVSASVSARNIMWNPRSVGDKYEDGDENIVVRICLCWPVHCICAYMHACIQSSTTGAEIDG
jgi:hypothetical protein